jgi:hypothetical protein
MSNKVCSNWSLAAIASWHNHMHAMHVGHTAIVVVVVVSLLATLPFALSLTMCG